MKRKGWCSMGAGGEGLELFSAYKFIESISQLRDV